MENLFLILYISLSNLPLINVTIKTHLLNQMNKFTTIELETYSESPEDWITESINDQLEDDESLYHRREWTHSRRTISR